VPDVPNLSDTSLRISVQKDDDETRHYEEKLVKWPQIIMTRDGRYSHELKPGRIDFLADLECLWIPVTIRLPWKPSFLMDASCFVSNQACF
jgi:hypothetical protein